ncbi:hypothetical protein [Bdellovibrio svalbardensis]|uniref:Uncharacterized protein n=1 Tax=Bdellovibrio svalbardensis TaxID=2972972 RepID=A0ABT6DMX1_9BACT|nr:hypothetical protein [Bdellovibrio svalbardensis]MDG0816483.1 hypothetical protein [Bdellovibrio svalbardensis]
MSTLKAESCLDIRTYLCLFPSRWWRLCICSTASLTISLSGSKGLAFDPTTLASGLTGAFGTIDETIGVGFALSDLLGELDVSPESEEEVRKAVGELEKLNSRVGEVNANSREVHQLLQADLSRAKSLQEKLRAIKTMIAASKRIAEVMGFRPKAGSYAAQVQQLKINSMILDELQAIRRQMFLSSLEERQNKARRSILLESIVEQEREKSLTPSGLRGVL